MFPAACSLFTAIASLHCLRHLRYRHPQAYYTRTSRNLHSIHTSLTVTHRQRFAAVMVERKQKKGTILIWKGGVFTRGDRVEKYILNRHVCLAVCRSYPIKPSLSHAISSCEIRPRPDLGLSFFCFRTTTFEGRTVHRWTLGVNLSGK